MRRLRKHLTTTSLGKLEGIEDEAKIDNIELIIDLQSYIYLNYYQNQKSFPR